MSKRMIIDGQLCVLRGNTFVTKATDELLNQIDRSVRATNDGPEVRVIRRDLLNKIRDYTGV